MPVLTCSFVPTYHTWLLVRTVPSPTPYHSLFFTCRYATKRVCLRCTVTDEESAADPRHSYHVARTWSETFIGANPAVDQVQYPPFVDTSDITVVGTQAALCSQCYGPLCEDHAAQIIASMYASLRIVCLPVPASIERRLDLFVVSVQQLLQLSLYLWILRLAVPLRASGKQL